MARHISRVYRLVFHELGDGKFRGPSCVSVTYDYEWALVKDVMEEMHEQGILEKKKGLYRIGTKASSAGRSENK